MAIEEQGTSTVVINGEEAKRELSVLEKMARKFSEQMKIANEAGDTKAWNKYAKGLTQTENAMRQVTKES